MLGVPNVAVILGEGGSGGADRDRHRQPRADAGARDLQRDLAGGRGLDPVARHHQGAGRRHQHEDHRRGPDCASASSTRSSPEPVGGAHRDPAAAIAATGEAIAAALAELPGLDREAVRRQRREKFLAIGRVLMTARFDAPVYAFVHRYACWKRRDHAFGTALSIAASLRITDRVTTGRRMVRLGIGQRGSGSIRG